MKKTLIIAGGGVIIIFAVIGFAFTAVFVGMQFGLLNVRGSIIERNASFGPVPAAIPDTTAPTSVTPQQNGPLPTTTVPAGTSTDTTSLGGNGCPLGTPEDSSCAWNETSQWTVVRDALVKDREVIERVSRETGVPPRMIASAVVPEQIRFFSDNREVFKRYFEPLKLLVSLSKFSLGVSGIKQETAEEIERYANDPTSPFYPGPGMSDLIAYAPDADHDQELFNRLTDEKNHYFSYLYTALCLKEISAHWWSAGFDVTKRPDVLVTLFNIGFAASAPKADPQVAGAAISLGGASYSFGYLGTLFYQSDELIDIFPRP